MIGNLTYEEYLKQGNTLTGDQVLDAIESLERKIVDMQIEREKQSKRQELESEQYHFAIEVIEQVQEIIKTETKARDIKKSIESVIENSYLEL